MTLLYLEGFDGASASEGTSSEDDVEAYLDARYITSTWDADGPQVFTPGWGGIGNALTLGDDGSADGHFIAFPVAETQETVIGFAMRVHQGAHPTADQRFIVFTHIDDNVDHITVNLVAGVHLEVRRGNETGTTLGVVPDFFKKGYWLYIEVKILISDTVGTIDIQKNGVNVLSLTGLDTRNGGFGDDIDRIYLLGVDGSGANDEDKVTLFDDIYVLDTAGSSPTNDFLGPVKVEEILPDGAGDDTDWTPSTGSNFQNVDETPRDDDTTYNESSTTTHLDLFTVGNLAQIDGTVYGVQVHALGRVTTGSTTLVPTVKSVAAEAADGGTSLSNTTEYLAVLGMFEDDPDAAAAWTATTVNAMQIGYEVG